MKLGSRVIIPDCNRTVDQFCGKYWENLYSQKGSFTILIKCQVFFLVSVLIGYVVFLAPARLTIHGGNWVSTCWFRWHQLNLYGKMGRKSNAAFTISRQISRIKIKSAPSWYKGYLAQLAPGLGKSWVTLFHYRFDLTNFTHCSKPLQSWHKIKWNHLFFWKNLVFEYI